MELCLEDTSLVNMFLVNVRPMGIREMEEVRCVMIDSKMRNSPIHNQCSSGVYLSLQGSDAARLKFWSCRKIVLSGEICFFFIRRGPRLPEEGNQSANVGGDVRLDAPARLSIKASLTLRSRWTS